MSSVVSLKIRSYTKFHNCPVEGLASVTAVVEAVMWKIDAESTLMGRWDDTPNVDKISIVLSMLFGYQEDKGSIESYTFIHFNFKLYIRVKNGVLDS